MMVMMMLVVMVFMIPDGQTDNQTQVIIKSLPRLKTQAFSVKTQIYFLFCQNTSSFSLILLDHVAQINLLHHGKKMKRNVTKLKPQQTQLIMTPVLDRDHILVPEMAVESTSSSSSSSFNKQEKFPFNKKVRNASHQVVVH